MTEKSYFSNKLTQWYLSLIKALQLQLFLSLVSLPFLVSWGLAISVMNVFATLLLTPFLAAFLLISSFIFFSELLNIPNTLWIWILEFITTTWITCLSIHQQWWLIGFTKPSIIALIAIMLLTLGILHSKQIKTPTLRTLALALLLLCVCVILKYFPYRYQTIEIIPHNKKNIFLLHCHDQLVMIDQGTLSSRASFESFIIYNLIPGIVQKTGKMNIEHIVATKINQRTFDALAFLSTKIRLKNIYVPWWTGKIPSFAWFSYKKLKNNISQSGGKIISISKNRQLIKNNDVALYFTVNNEKNVHYYDATYPTLSVDGVIGEEKINI